MVKIFLMEHDFVWKHWLNEPDMLVETNWVWTQSKYETHKF